MSINSNSNTGRGSRLLWLALIVLLAVTAYRMRLVLSRHSQLSKEAGVWSGLAIDYAHGTLYRPLVSEIGYGGTRYFPLYFLLHGELIKHGVPVLAAGYAVTFVSMAMLLIVALALMWRLGVPPAVAIAFTLLILCSISMQAAATSIRGDLLPAALSLAGVLICARANRWDDDVESASARPAGPGVAAMILAGVCFGLAIVAKPTSVAGLGAVGLCLLLHRRIGAAVILGAISAAIGGGLLALVNYASHGRFLTSFTTCASGGGGLASVKNMPFRFIWVLIDRDGPALLVLALAIATLILQPLRRWRELPTLLLIVTAACTAAIFLTPGIDRNHNHELHVAALVFLAAQAARLRIDPALVKTFLAVTAIAGAWYFAMGMREEEKRTLRDDYVNAYHELAPQGGALLSDNPMASIFVGQTPYILDDFMLGVLGDKDPAFRNNIYNKLKSQEFKAIIFDRDPNEDEGQHMMGPEFGKLLQQYYELTPSNRFWTYRPKGR